MRRFFASVVIALVAPCLARADAEPRTVISFRHTQDVGFGRSVFVVGSHPDIGNWTPTGGVKLRFTAGNVWTGQIAVRSGESIEFKYVHRSTAPDQICNPANVTWISPANIATSTPSIGPAPYAGKTMFYYSGWTQVFLLASTDGVSFADAPLTQVSTGRTAGEFLYRGQGIGSAGGTLEFVLHNGAGDFDKAPFGGYGDSNYFTRLDAFVVQDGQIYNYWPAPSVSPPSIVSTFVNSSVAGITGRGVRIYLPRGYAEHTWKRYPVFYFQDGTNIFDPGSPNGSWSADATATREIHQGRLRETILVAIDNIPNYRRTEYMPPTDTYFNHPPGTADRFLRFLVDNVRPTLDGNYRTWNDPRNTYVGGSSMGGLFSLYAVYETNVFGAALAMSPALGRGTNYLAALWTKSRRPVRIYMDTGTAEGLVGDPPQVDYWETPLRGYDALLSQGYAVNGDLLWRQGCGQGHNEAAWRSRLPGALAFLLDVREEPSPLLGSVAPPRITGVPTGIVSTSVLRQQSIRFERASGLDAAWQPVTTTAVEQLPWGVASFTNAPSAETEFLRAVAVPRP